MSFSAPLLDHRLPAWGIDPFFWSIAGSQSSVGQRRVLCSARLSAIYTMGSKVRNAVASEGEGQLVSVLWEVECEGKARGRRKRREAMDG